MAVSDSASGSAPAPPFALRAATTEDQRPHRRRPLSLRRPHFAGRPTPGRCTSTYPHKSGIATASRRCRTSTSTMRTIRSARGAEGGCLSAKYGKKLPCDPARRWMTSTGAAARSSASSSSRNKGENSPAQGPPGRRFMESPTGRQGLRLQHRAGERLHPAVRRQHLGRDPGSKVTPSVVVNSPKAVEALEHYLVGAGYMPLGRQDRQHGHLQAPTSCSARARSPRASSGSASPRARSRPRTSKVADIIAFAVQARASEGPTASCHPLGEYRRRSRFVIMTWADDAQVGETVDFVEVVALARRWPAPSSRGAGGQSAVKSVYKDPSLREPIVRGTGPGRQASTGRRTLRTSRVLRTPGAGPEEHVLGRSPASRRAETASTTSPSTQKLLEGGRPSRSFNGLA